MTQPIGDATARPDAAPLPVQIGVFTATRTVINSGFRMLYPFLPVIARGLGIEPSTAALIVTARATVGLASPLLGSAADVWGRRAALLASLGVIMAAMLAVVIWPTFPVLLVAMVLAATAKMVVEPAMWAYLSDRIAYARRGLALAITEISWSSAFLVGMPLVGIAIAAHGWTAPFPWLAGLTLAGAVAIRLIMPADHRHSSQRPSFISSARIVLAHRPALAGLLVAALISTANEVVAIVFGQVMEDSFSLQVAALGLASTVIGVSELAGEGLVAGIVDRLGKRRAVMLGISANMLISLALPLFARTLAGALAGLFLFYFTFEFSVVSVIPLMTELVPEARATMMAGNAAAFSLGRALGSLLGPALYAYGLLAASGIAAAGIDVAAVALLFFFIPADRP